MINFTKDTFDWRAIALLVASILAVLLGSWSPDLILLPLTIIVFGFGIVSLFSSPFRQMLPSFSLVDAAVSVLLLVEAVNYIYSIYPPNSFVFLQKIHFFGLLYVLLRLNFSNLASRNILLIGLGGYAFILAVGAFFSFLFLQTQLHFDGWEDASQFKRLYSPFGLLNNEWATISLCLLPFPLIAAALFRFSKIALAVCALAFAILNASALVSFSRGAYLTLGLFWLLAIGGVYFFKALSIKTLTRSVIAVGMLTFLFIIPIRTPFLTTLAMNKTVTQQRSTQGRIEILKSGWCLAQDHLWLGVGGNNYPIVNDQCQTPREDQGYSGFTNNTYLQILIEKGIFGLLMYGFLFLIIILHLIKKISQSFDTEERLVNVLLLAGFLTLCCRELFFSALFYSPFVIVLLAIFTAAAAPSGSTEARSSKLAWSAFGIFLLLITSWILYQNSRTKQAAAFAQKAVLAWDTNDKPNALSQLNQALALAPNDAPYHELAGLIEAQSDIPLSDFVKDSLQIDSIAIQKAIPHFQKALQLNPLDAGFHFNLGWLYFLQKQPGLASKHLNRALELEPNNAEFWIGEGVFLEATADSTAAFRIYQAYERAVQLDPEIADSEVFEDFEIRFPSQTYRFIPNLIYKIQNEQKYKGNYGPIIAARLGKLQIADSSITSAKATLTGVLNQLPDLNRPYYNLAVIALIEQDTTQAMTLLQKSYFLNPNDYLPALALGDIYYQRAGKEKSTAFTVIRYYQVALRNWLSGSTIHRVRADIKYQNSIAITNDLIPKDLLQGIKTQLNFPQIAGRIAEMYTKLGNKEGAQYYQSLSGQSLQTLRAEAIR